MLVSRIWLTDFRNYTTAETTLAPGLTVVVGGNGEGKTSLLEAVGYLATLSSFRAAPTEALVRHGCERAVVRAEGMRGPRELLLEAEVPLTGRARVAVNRQPLRRARDLLGALRVTVFSPDDLVLVKGGPGERRRYLDDVLVALHTKNDALRGELERVLRQRNTLLRQLGGRLTPEGAATLDVWDAKLVETGEAVADARQALVDTLEPVLARAFADVAGHTMPVWARYEAPWREKGLAAALTLARADELRRGISLVGPQRDELVLELEGRPARTHASQGEQRALALALRLAAHQLVTAAVGEPPVLLLDDVFSELDATRAAALVAHLPTGQALLTTAHALPPGAPPDLLLRVHAGRVAAA
ncbi:MAG: DNA replication and repair protein RecF [Acidimicrobiia bacterium]|nr:DNA replication and repair protein RecF [Acidimicrobiia bacterium]